MGSKCWLVGREVAPKGVSVRLWQGSRGHRKILEDEPAENLSATVACPFPAADPVVFWAGFCDFHIEEERQAG